MNLTSGGRYACEREGPAALAGGDVESDQMQQEQNDGGIYAGDHIAVILSISQL